MKNFIIVSFALCLFGCASTQSGDELGYEGHKKNASGKSKPLETLKLLKSDPDVSFRITRGWSVASKNTDEEKAIWSFPPESHEAYPSVVKRKVEQANGQIGIVTTVKCGATKPVCDRLVRDFIKLNDNMKQSINAQ